MRPGELRALTWADVDLKARTISVSKAIDGHNGTVKPRKNAQGQRVIPTVLQRLHEACDVMSFEVVRHEVLEDQVIVVGRLAADGIVNVDFGCASITRDGAGLAAIVAGMKEVAQLGLSASRHLRGDVYEVRADAPG